MLNIEFSPAFYELDFLGFFFTIFKAMAPPVAAIAALAQLGEKYGPQVMEEAMEAVKRVDQKAVVNVLTSQSGSSKDKADRIARIVAAGVFGVEHNAGAHGKGMRRIVSEGASRLWKSSGGASSIAKKVFGGSKSFRKPALKSPHFPTKARFARR